MKIQLTVTTDAGVSTTMVVEASRKAYEYIERVLVISMAEIFREEANGLPHGGKKADPTHDA